MSTSPQNIFATAALKSVAALDDNEMSDLQSRLNVMSRSDARFMNNLAASGIDKGLGSLHDRGYDTHDRSQD